MVKLPPVNNQMVGIRKRVLRGGFTWTDPRGHSKAAQCMPDVGCAEVGTALSFLSQSAELATCTFRTAACFSLQSSSVCE
jgi:hypothetical protein